MDRHCNITYIYFIWSNVNCQTRINYVNSSYTIINLQTTIVWKDYKSRLWLLTLILAIAMIIAGIYILVNSGAILQTVGVAIVVYGIVDIIENIIFIKKVDDYLE